MQLADSVAAQEAGIPSELYTVTFGSEAIGMIVVIDQDTGRVVVGDLRDGQAKASGKVQAGDFVLSVNDRSFSRCTKLSEVSEDFAQAQRPVCVLFQRAPKASLEL